MKFTTALTLLLMSTAIPMQSAYAQVAEADDMSLESLYQLNIDELITVSVASKKEETIKEAPSIISVVTKDDIKRYGALSLSDVLNRVPSLQIYSSPFLPNNPVSVRGQSNQHYPNRLLFLINNRPFRDATTGGWTSPLLTQFPVSAIEKIEIIRGPGSVLYGTGAFSSVVNIVTKHETEDNGGEISTTVGTFARRDIEGSWKHQGDDWHVYGAVKDSYSEGWRASLTDELGATGSYDMTEDGNGYFLNAKYHDFSVNVFKGRSEEKSLGPLIRFPTRAHELNRVMTDVSYQTKIHQDWTLDLHATHNNFVLDNSSATGQADNSENNYIGEASLKANLTDKLSALIGGSYEYYNGETSNVDFHTERSSGYAQLDYRPWDWLKLVGGLQLNKPKDVKKDFSPRAAAILFLDQNWTMKFMYGEAFRSSAVVEAFINIPNVLTGNSSVSPEKIATSEAQLLYTDNGLSTSLTGYHSRITDIIGRVPFGGGGLTFDNTGEEIYEGLEFEAKKKFSNGWCLDGSFLVQQAENSADLDNPNFTTNVMVKGGVSYISRQGWDFGIFNSYFGAPEDVRDADSGVAEVNPQPDAYHMLSGNLNIDVAKLLNKEDRMPDITFSLYGENLLDEDIDYPEFNRKNINSFPMDGGRAVYAKVSIKF